MTIQMDRYSSDIFSDKTVGYTAVIQDWYDLAVATNIKPQSLAHALRNRVAMQTQIRIKDRTVYNSAPTLKNVQEKLIPFFKGMYSQVDTEPMLAYVKGKDPRQVLRGCTGFKYEVLFDIRKYYDHITFRHLVEMFQGFGMSEMGAKLVTRYCVVKRNVGGQAISTLQQGSPCSPILSNLIGAVLIDQPIMAWLNEKASQHPRMTYKYYRYSDNAALFLDGEIPLDFIKEYRAFTTRILNRARIQGHKWQVIPSNHPKRNQKFLGIVLNSITRIEKTEFQRLRAMLFNACKDGISTAAEEYWELNQHKYLDIQLRWGEVPTDFKIEKFKQVLQGNIAYVHSVNPEHALMLRKLLKASEALCAQGYDRALFPGLFGLIKQYKRKEPLEPFMGRIARAIGGSSTSDVCLEDNDLI